MALTIPRRKAAARWFINNVFKKDGKPAVVTRGELFTALDEGDDFLINSPGGGVQSTMVKFRNSINATFKNRFTLPDFVENDVLDMLLAAIALAKAGFLT